MASARAYCAELKRSVAAANDVPVEHLRAAEQHLAVIEKWLVANRIHSIRKNEVPVWQAERLMHDLGLVAGQERDEAIEDFRARFDPPPDEAFVTSVSCAAVSQSFRYPGKLFISCFRLRFDSQLLGMHVNVALPWDEVKSLRYVPSTKTTTFPVRISTKSKKEFDGKAVDEIYIRVFDYNGLRILHKSAMYFLGTGLFGMWQEGEEGAALPTAVSEAPVKARNDEASAARALQQTFAIWEVERRSTPFTSWGAPSMPGDGVRRMKWCACDPAGNFIRHPFVPEDADTSHFPESASPPLEDVEFLGQQRRCTWTKVSPAEGETDAESWQYSSGFDVHTGWSPECSSFSTARRRCWLPRFVADNVPKLDKLATTYIKQKGIGVGGATPKLVFEANLGAISLEKLGSELTNDASWEPNPDGGLMAMYMHKLQVRDMEIGAWTRASGKVQGVVRSVDYVKPLPPKPMCPKESRIQTTVHVVNREDTVVFEQRIMTLDVPAGSSWSLWVRDTFTVSDGNMKMSRDCACEWLQSSWLKSMIEKEVPAGVEETAPDLVEIIKKWASN
eukprot:TRINITY_DN64012_c0_g1_i1.p1 TRINITY_DN64012_c0_g1~~TRINITY_DN64012_c0_g1_i1.p1  ORF type:complete len:614 (-),score=151.11 TRINITY_DN64012_c0_g1_i1:215-1897(-)